MQGSVPRDEEVGSSGAAAEQSSDLEARECDDLEDDKENDDIVFEESVELELEVESGDFTLDEGVVSSTEEVGASGTGEKGDFGEGDELPVGLPGESLEAFLILILKTTDVSFSIMNILSVIMIASYDSNCTRMKCNVLIIYF